MTVQDKKMDWREEFQQKIGCYCPCHIDDENVFSFRDGIHCDICYDKSISKKELNFWLKRSKGK